MENNKDLEISYKILHDFIYQGDQLVFELELNKISDYSLKMGLLFDLYSKTGYEANRKDIIRMIQIQSNEDIFSDLDLFVSSMSIHQQYFLNSIKTYMRDIVSKDKFSVEVMSESLSFIESLKDYPEDVIWFENSEIVKSVRLLSPSSVLFLKDLLLKSENYEWIVYLDKCLVEDVG